MYSAGHADIMKHKKDVGGESMLTLDMVREAQEALRGIARRTPLDRAPKFGENVYIKAENLQLTGAFKLRGAYNKMTAAVTALLNKELNIPSERIYVKYEEVKYWGYDGSNF